MFQVCEFTIKFPRNPNGPCRRQRRSRTALERHRHWAVGGGDDSAGSNGVANRQASNLGTALRSKPLTGGVGGRVREGIQGQRWRRPTAGVDDGKAIETR